MKSLSFRAARFRGQNPESVPFDTMSKSLVPDHGFAASGMTTGC
jgi:hypothetical protein